LGIEIRENQRRKVFFLHAVKVGDARVMRLPALPKAMAASLKWVVGDALQMRMANGQVIIERYTQAGEKDERSNAQPASKREGTEHRGV